MPPLNFRMDVVADSESAATLRAELSRTEDPKRAALLSFELGRLALGNGDEATAARDFARCYAFRPQFRPALHLNQLLCRHRGDLALAAKVLEAQARATRTPEEQAAIARQRARLLWSGTEGAGDARAALGQAAGAGDWATLLLRDLLDGATGRLEERRAVLMQELEVAEDPRLRAALRVDLALAIGPPDEEALALLRDAASSEPDAAVALGFLEHLTLVAGRLDEMARTIRRRAEAVSGAARRSALLAHAARIHRDHLEDLATAAELMSTAHALQPGQLDLAADHFTLQMALGRAEEASAAGERLVELEPIPLVRSGLAFEIGERCRRAGRPDLASAWLRRALWFTPDFEVALATLVPDLILNDRLSDADERVSSAREAAGSSDRSLDLRYQQAVLYELSGRLDEAVAAHRDVLEAAPTHLPSFTALKRIYSGQERRGDLVDLLQRQLDGLDDADRVPLLEVSGALLAVTPEGGARALSCYRQAAELQPRRLSALRATARLCEATERWEDLVAVSERELELVEDRQRRLELMHLVAELLEMRLGRSTEALEQHERVLQIDPTYLPSLQALGRLYQHAGRFEDLARMHRAEVDQASDPEQTIYLLDAVAEIARTHLDVAGAAEQAYREILEHRPRYLPAVLSLSDVLAYRGAWKDLNDLLSNTAERVTEGQSRQLLLLQIGDLRRLRLDPSEKPARAFCQAIRLGDEPRITWPALVRLVDRWAPSPHLAQLLGCLLAQILPGREIAPLVSQLGDALDQADAHRTVTLMLQLVEHARLPTWLIWFLLGELGRLGSDSAMHSLLEHLRRGEVDATLQAPLRLALARLTLDARLGEPVEVLRAGAAWTPGRRHAVRQAERLLRSPRRPQNPGRQAALIALIIEHTSDTVELGLLHGQLGEALEGANDPQGAERAFREALRHSAANHRACWGLGRLLERQERWGDLAELCERQLAVLRCDENAVALAVHGARMWLKADDPDRAIRLLKRANALDPGHPDACRDLRRLLTKRGDWAGLAEVIESSLDRAGSASDVEDLVELGVIHHRRLGQLQRARRFLERALALDDHNGQVLRLLGDLSFEQERWEDSASCYRRAEWYLFDPESIAHVRRRLAEALLAMGRPEEALEMLGRVLPRDGTADPQALKTLARAAEQSGDHRRQLDALELLARASSDAQMQTQALRSAAVVADGALGDDERAIALLGRVLEIDPLQIETIEALAAIHGRASDRDGVERLMDAAVASHRRALAERPFDRRLYFQLSRIFRWQRQFDPQYCSYVALSRLGPLESIERKFLARHHDLCLTEPIGLLETRDYDGQLFPADADPLARELVQLLGERTARSVASSPSRYGLSRGDRSTGGVRDLCLEMARVLGLTDLKLEVWVTAQHPNLIAAEVFGKPALVVGQHFVDRPHLASARFHVGRALCLLYEGRLVLQRWSGKDNRALLFALAGVADPPADPERVASRLGNPGHRIAKKADTLAQTLTRLLGRRDRRRLAALLEPGLPDLDAHGQVLERAACRCGLVLAGDPTAAISEAEHLPDGQRGPWMADLLQFLVGQSYFAIRQKLGIAPETD